MAPRQRVARIVRNVLVELLIFLLADLALGARPQRAGAVDRFPLRLCRRIGVFAVMFLAHFDRQADMVGILLEDAAQRPAVGKAVFAFFQLQHDAGAALGLVDAGDFELAFATRGPMHAFVGGQAGAARIHVDLVGDDEGAIEPHAELADQVGVLLLVAAQVLKEVGSAGLGDRAQMRDRIFAAHADAVVVDGDGARVLVVVHANAQLAAAFQQFRLHQCFETQLVGGVGGIGHQLAQEDFLVRVQRVDHQLQQLLDLGLEAKRLLVGINGHWGRAPWWPRPQCGRWPGG